MVAYKRGKSYILTHRCSVFILLFILWSSWVFTLTLSRRAFVSSALVNEFSIDFYVSHKIVRYLHQKKYKKQVFLSTIEWFDRRIFIPMLIHVVLLARMLLRRKKINCVLLFSSFFSFYLYWIWSLYFFVCDVSGNFVVDVIVQAMFWWNVFTPGM